MSFSDEVGNWKPARNLGEKINTSSLDYCPSISPDGLYLFYSSRTSGGGPYWDGQRTFPELRRFLKDPLNGSGDIFWVEMSVIEQLR
ncbi:MAG: PD40 domain-containing protein [Proteobacteria bacterium]|nr:PD40 domain-containing protein [Pseudomonadota bacterium]